MEKVRKIGKIILDILTVIVVLAILLVMYNYAQINWFGKKYANLFGYSMLEVSTGSMAKTINVYDIIIVKITNEVEKNDIITFEQDGELITHRIIEINGDEIITKGDANNAKDQSITKENIVGKVVSIWPKAGIWIKVISEPKVFVSIIITIFLIGKVFSKDRRERNAESIYSYDTEDKYNKISERNEKDNEKNNYNNENNNNNNNNNYNNKRNSYNNETKNNLDRNIENKPRKRTEERHRKNTDN